jgi:DNA-binding transcriptional regulator YiaG
MATLGDVVRNERRAAEMATDELANLLGVDRSTVAGWETGHSVPRVGNLVMLWLVLPGMAHALDDHVTAARERHHAA